VHLDQLANVLFQIVLVRPIKDAAGQVVVRVGTALSATAVPAVRMPPRRHISVSKGICSAPTSDGVSQF
jgi:hypothetical protein